MTFSYFLNWIYISRGKVDDVEGRYSIKRRVLEELKTNRFYAIRVLNTKGTILKEIDASFFGNIASVSILFLTYCIYIYHHVVPLAWISLTLSRHFSLLFIASDRSSGLHPVSSHSWCMYVWAGRPAFARPYVGVHRSTSLISSSLLLQQYPACLVRLTWIVFVMGGRWTYSWCFVGCCCQDLFNIARSRRL